MVATSDPGDSVHRQTLLFTEGVEKSPDGGMLTRDEIVEGVVESLKCVCSPSRASEVSSVQVPHQNREERGHPSSTNREPDPGSLTVAKERKLVGEEGRGQLFVSSDDVWGREEC